MSKLQKDLLPALGAGLIGALVLNLLHESVRQCVDDAPRIDLLGEEALKKIARKADVSLPRDKEALYALTLGSDVISNTLYYSLVGLAKPKHALPMGSMLGLAAGVGAVTLPGPMGLSTAPVRRTNATAVMSVGWYWVGGAVAGLAYQWLRRK